MNDLDFIRLLERENKEILLSILIELCEKNKNNKETCILLLNKK